MLEEEGEKKKFKSIQKHSQCREFITLRLISRLRCLHATLEIHYLMLHKMLVFLEKDRKKKGS